MERRELFKSLILAPFVLRGKPLEGTAAVEMGSGEFLLFFASHAIDVNLLVESLQYHEGDPVPAWRSIRLVPVHLRTEEKLEDVVQLYKV